MSRGRCRWRRYLCRHYPPSWRNCSQRGTELMAAQVRMRVWRGDASGGDFRTFEVASEEGMVVLDVIHRIAETQAPDLAVRWNCKAGRCGSRSAQGNGPRRPRGLARMKTFVERDA